MKLRYLLFSSLVLILLSFPVKAQIILNPGESKVFTNYPATGGEAGDNGNFIFILNSAYDINAKTIKAEVISRIIGTGKGEAYALLYYDFTISETPETHNNTVGALISYSIFWNGFQEMIALVGSNSWVNIEMHLKDLTATQLICSDIIHDLDLKTASIKVVNIGLDYNDSDTKNDVVPAILKRGHTYRLNVKLTCTLFATLTPLHVRSMCDFMDGILGLGDGRVELSNIFVKVGLDEEETLQKLIKLDSLESRIDSLEYKLNHHYHIYLTGRGIGQNNTEANTTLSIFEEGNSASSPPIYNEIPEQNILKENIENKSSPDKFSLGQNYPNPFNPSTKITFAIPKQELVTIKVFDILGRQVKILMNEIKSPGYYEINFEAGRYPSGTYVYEIRAGDFVETKKMILLK